MNLGAIPEDLPDAWVEDRIATLSVTPARLKTKGWTVPVILNQGQTPHCVGFSWAHELAGDPVRVPGISKDYAVGLYREAQTRDSLPGENYDGTSNRAGAETCKARGHISGYRFIGTTDAAQCLRETQLAVGYEGPVVMTLPWFGEGVDERGFGFGGMYTPDAEGHIHVAGDLMGFHAVVLSAVRLADKDFIVHNSWGQSYGRNGRAYLPFTEFEKLRQNHIELCVPHGRG